jgi:hypothetical protein
MIEATNHRPHKNSWATGAFCTRSLHIPNQPTQFDALVYKLGLEKRPDLWRDSTKLVAFARKNAKHRYVPESFLCELGIGTEDIPL